MCLSMVSKAALRSWSISIVGWLWGPGRSKSFRTLRRAVSVLWLDLYADWNLVPKSWLFKYFCNLEVTIVSTILEREVNCLLDDSFWGHFYFIQIFFSTGLTTALFKMQGISPISRLQFIINVMAGVGSLAHSFNILLGKTSRVQVLFGRCLKFLFTSSSEAGENEFRIVSWVVY